MNTHRFEHCIAGRTYVIEVLPVSTARWRAQIARLPGMPTSLMPFYGETPEDFTRQLTESGAKVAVLCSSAKVYAAQGVAVAEALRAAGAETVLVAGQIKELGEGAEGAVDGNVFDGMNVVELLTTTLNKMGA